MFLINEDVKTKVAKSGLSAESFYMMDAVSTMHTIYSATVEHIKLTFIPFMDTHRLPAERFRKFFNEDELIQKGIKKANELKKQVETLAEPSLSEKDTKMFNDDLGMFNKLFDEFTKKYNA